MANDNKKTNPPRRGMGMRRPVEKAKDFKGAMKRLLKELKVFKTFITISVILAILGSILSIAAPDRLSELTDTISEGLVVNRDNLEKISGEMTENLSSKEISENITQIITPDFSEGAISSIMLNKDIPDYDKKNFTSLMSDMDESADYNDILKNINSQPLTIKKTIYPSITIENKKIESIDRIKFIDLVTNAEIDFNNIASKKEVEEKRSSSLIQMRNKMNLLDNIPDSIKEVIFKEFEIDGVKISSNDQIVFLKLMSSTDENTPIQSLYGRMDKLPDSIKGLISPKMDMDKIIRIALFISGMYIFSSLFEFIQGLIMANVSNNFAKRLRTNISEKINKLPLKYFDRNSTGDILSRVTNDVDTIAQSMNQSLGILVSSTTLFLGTIIMMFYTNWIMAITAIASSLIGFSFMALILKNSQKYFVARQQELGKLNGHIEEIYSGLNVVKVYNGRKEADLKFDELNKNVYNANRKSQFLSGLMHPMMGFVGNFGYVAVCIVGALLTMNDIITFGVIVAFMTYVRLFTSPLSEIAQAMTSLQSTAAASERVFEFVDEKEMSDQKEIKTYLDKKDAKGDIVFDNVVFKYEDSESPVIKGFSAKASSGQKVAIVGPTGAGKTTMVNLLMKFYDIDSGDIRIDGISTKELTRANIHDLFTMVLQDTWIFNGSVKENIIYNNENVTEEDVKEVCKTVGLDHFIRTLPHGYDSKISDNDSISAGQRQLITIARGILQDTPFLILDEATSNVDTRTEELVQSAMDKLAEGKTSFIIAHRLSTIKNADLILVMKDGNIIEHGNHEELMKKKGFYADLYNSQFAL